MHDPFSSRKPAHQESEPTHIACIMHVAVGDVGSTACLTAAPCLLLLANAGLLSRS